MGLMPSLAGFGSGIANAFAQGAAAQSTGAGKGFSLGNLMNNRLLWELLAAGGYAVNPTPGTKGIYDAVSKANSSQSVMGMLSKMLSSGGKLTMDGENIKMQMPNPYSQGSTQTTTPGPEQIQQSPVVSQGPTAQPTTTGGAGGTMTNTGTQRLGLPELIGLGGRMLGGSSPFGVDLSGFTASDLAGLSPQDIFQVLGTKFTQGQLEQKSLADVADMIYKQGELEYKQGQLALGKSAQDIDREQLEAVRYKNETDRMNAIRQIADELREAPIEIPGIGKVDLKSFSALDTKTKAYSYYVFDQKKNGRAPLVYEAWEAQNDMPAIERYYERSKTDSNFKKFLMEYRRAGSTNINLSPFEQTRQRELAQAQALVMAPDYHSKLSKRLDRTDFEIQFGEQIDKFAKDNKLIYEEAYTKVRGIYDLQLMDTEIRQAFEGHDVERRLDGWYVDGVRKVRNPYATD